MSPARVLMARSSQIRAAEQLLNFVFSFAGLFRKSPTAIMHSRMSYQYKIPAVGGDRTPERTC